MVAADLRVVLRALESGWRPEWMPKDSIVAIDRGADLLSVLDAHVEPANRANVYFAVEAMLSSGQPFSIWESEPGRKAREVAALVRLAMRRAEAQERE